MTLQNRLKIINDQFVGCDHWEPLRAFAYEASLEKNHGKGAIWESALQALEGSTSLDTEQRIEQLMNFLPWRKGPLNLFGIPIDTEWRSDWKWKRLIDCGLEFTEKTVLDVGCGNGFFMYEMLKAGAEKVVGVDPTFLFAAQFMAMQVDQPTNKLAFVPSGLELCPPTPETFDLVMSMGVLYHRKDQHQHLEDLIQRTKTGGQILLETLILEGEGEEELTPHLVGNKRYAQMRNVWAVPTIPLLTKRMTESGYRNIKLLDCEFTSLDEQRSTDWMVFHSLPEFLDPFDRRKTVEGYQAPKRAIMLADKS